LGVLYGFFGQYEKAITETQEAIRLEATVPAGYSNLEGFYTRLNRLDEAKAVYEQARARGLSFPDFHLDLYWIGFLQGDAEAMTREVSQARENPGIQTEMLNIQSNTEAFRGRLGSARALTRRALESATRAGLKGVAGTVQAEGALREALFGNAAMARKESAAAVTRSSGMNVRVIAALAMAQTGEVASAERLAVELAREYPLSTLVQFSYLPTVHAEIELSRGNPARALELLETAASHELGSWSGDSPMALFPAYVRGRAFLRAGNPSEAVREFQKIIDHPGIVLNSPQGALARLGLARAHSLAGDTAKARQAYQDFLTLWKDGDPDIPILQEAKTEYARLN